VGFKNGVWRDMIKEWSVEGCDLRMECGGIGIQNGVCRGGIKEWSVEVWDYRMECEGVGLKNGVWREGLKNGVWNGIYEKRELFKRGRGREKREGRDGGGGREDKGIHILRVGGRVGGLGRRRKMT